MERGNVYEGPVVCMNMYMLYLQLCKCSEDQAHVLRGCDMSTQMEELIQMKNGFTVYL